MGLLDLPDDILGQVMLRLAIVREPLWPLAALAAEWARLTLTCTRLRRLADTYLLPTLAAQSRMPLWPGAARGDELHCEEMRSGAGWNAYASLSGNRLRPFLQWAGVIDDTSTHSIRSLVEQRDRYHTFLRGGHPSLIPLKVVVGRDRAAYLTVRRACRLFGLSPSDVWEECRTNIRTMDVFNATCDCHVPLVVVRQMARRRPS